MCRRLLKCGVSPLQYVSRYSPGGKGTHIVVTIAGKFNKFAIIVLQLLLGSDSEREIQNFRRACLAPKEWGDKWNVLYRR